MVASGQVESFFGGFLDDVIGTLINPREGPGGRELAKRGYELFATQRRGLSRTEIWVESKDRKVTDIRVVDYSAGGLFRDTKYGTKFDSMDMARNFFARYGVSNEQFVGLESGIRLWKRQTQFHDREIDGWNPWFHEAYTQTVRGPHFEVFS